MTRRTIRRTYSSWLFLLCLLVINASAAEDWLAKTRAAIERKDVAAAISIVNQQLAEYPEDWEALGWHARLTARQGDWRTAETEYRRVLEHTPADNDIILGLSDVLTWQNKHSEALEVLARAASSTPQDEVLRRRARLLTALGRTEEAKSVYELLLTISPNDREAKAALHPNEAPKFELRIGNDTDAFNYTDTANAQSISLRTRLTPRWTTTIGGEFYQRFGQDARKLRVGSTVNVSRADYINVGGAFANPQDVISRYDQSIEYGHVFKIGNGFFRGLETSVEQRALWFTDSQLTLLRGGAFLYLPRDWMWSFSVTGARTSFDLAGTSWEPSGSTRLWFPISGHIQGNILFAIGSEDYSNVDQIGRFSAHTYGGGLRIRVTDYQEFSFYGAYQLRSHERSQTSAGVSYAIRF